MSMETVEDRTVEFLLVHSEGSAEPDLASLAEKPFPRKHWREAFDSVQIDERKRVWQLKSSLDAVDGALYTAVRDKLFPLATSGKPVGQGFFNRAGHKLLESMEATGVWQWLVALQKTGGRTKRGRSGGSGGLANAVVFADVCGGPGAFSQALFAVCPKHRLRLRGFGLTLEGKEGLDWYPELVRNRRFTATYGLDGTGDVFQLSNLEALASLTQGSNMLLVVADGGFSVGFDIANYQETISARITYGQWLGAVKLLAKGGCFVLKLFDSFSPMTRSLLYLSTFLYERVHIVKPKHSRVVNSERYLVCVGFRGLPSPAWMAHFDACYTGGFTDNDHVPELVPTEWMQRDADFMEGIKDMNTTIASNQAIALHMILRALEERNVIGGAPCEPSATVGTEHREKSEGDREEATDTP